MKSNIANEKYICKTNVRKHNTDIFQLLQELAGLVKKGTLDKCPDFSHLDGNFEEYVRMSITDQRNHNLDLIELCKDQLLDFEAISKSISSKNGKLELYDDVAELDDMHMIMAKIGKNNTCRIIEQIIKFPTEEETIWKLNGQEIDHKEGMRLYKKAGEELSWDDFNKFDFLQDHSAMQTSEGLVEHVVMKRGYDTKISISYNEMEKLISERIDAALKSKEEDELWNKHHATSKEKKERAKARRLAKMRGDIGNKKNGVSGNTIYANKDYYSAAEYKRNRRN